MHRVCASSGPIVLPAAVAALLVVRLDVRRPGAAPAAALERRARAGSRQCATGSTAPAGRALRDRAVRRLRPSGSGRPADAFADACAEAVPARKVGAACELRGRGSSASCSTGASCIVEGGLSGRSRIEPRLGEALTALGEGGPVEVRCWAQSDWRWVLAEEAALTGAPRGGARRSGCRRSDRCSCRACTAARSSGWRSAGSRGGARSGSTSRSRSGPSPVRPSRASCRGGWRRPSARQRPLRGRARALRDRRARTAPAAGGRPVAVSRPT